jgi:hypothetical protein
MMSAKERSTWSEYMKCEGWQQYFMPPNMTSEAARDELLEIVVKLRGAVNSQGEPAAPEAKEEPHG